MDPVKRRIKLFICIVFVLCGVDANAQVSLIQQAIDKIDIYENISYQFVVKQKEYTNDTLIMTHKDVLIKVPADTTFGYWFSLETLTKGNKFPYIDVYNGQHLMQLNPEDSTYTIKEIQPYIFGGSLPGYLRTLNNLLKKRPYEIAGDTTINAIACSHIIMNTYDTIINKEHYYTRIHIFFNKLSALPVSIIANSRNARNGDGITNYYAEYRYFDYKFNEDHVDTASVAIPRGYHLPKDGPPLPALLASGTVAPGWVLYSAEGKKTSLAQLKGKVVLLDFFFIGCEGCMLSLKPLNKLHEKYKGKNVEMVSMTYRDSKPSVIAFTKNYNIKYPIYLNAGEVVKSYHVLAFPTFYFIDKKGKIANVVVGYEDDFEEKVTSLLDGLLN